MVRLIVTALVSKGEVCFSSISFFFVKKNEISIRCQSFLSVSALICVKLFDIENVP